jgi:hypothetical protein
LTNLGEIKMALKKTVTTPQGFEAQDAYHRVENLTLLAKDTMSFAVRSYKQSTGVPAFAETQHTAVYDIACDNPIAQAYTAAKALPQFTDAKDC